MSNVNGTRVHEDVRLTLIFPNGKEHRVKTAENIEYGNNVTGSQIGGTQVGPVANAGSSAEPTYNLDITSAEKDEIITKMGPGYVRVEFSMVCYFRPIGDLAAKTDYIDGCKYEDGTNSSARGAAWRSPFAGKCTKVRFNGIDPFGDDEE